MVAGDYRKLLERPAEITRVTAADVQRAAGQYLAGRPRVVVVAAPGRRPPDHEVRPCTPSYGSPHGGRHPAPRAHRRGGRAARGPGPAGARVLVDQAPALPLVWVTVAARTGSAADPKGKEGLATFAAELARRGAGGRPRAALDDALDGLGATLAVDVDQDSVRLAGQVLVRHLDAFLDLLADVVLRPDFPADELERTRKELVAQLEEARNDDQALCARFFERRLYGDHPYGRPARRDRQEPGPHPPRGRRPAAHAGPSWAAT